MVARIGEILDHVPVVARPATRNDASTIAALAEGIEPRLVDWALAVATGAAAEVYRDVAPSRFEVLGAVIGRSIESISINLLRYLLSGRDSATAVRISRAQRQTALDSVHLAIPLDRVIGGFRTLDHHWRRAFIELVLEQMPREDAVELLSGIDRSLAIYFGTLIDENSRIYLDERQRLSDERVTGQRALLERIAAGHQVTDSALAETFGVRSGDELRLLVVSASPPGDGRGPVLDFAAYGRAIERRFREHLVVAIPADGDTVWILLSGPRMRDDELQDRLTLVGEDVPGALVSFGLAGRGAEGLRRAHHTAGAAHALLRRAPGIGPIVAFAEHGLLTLLAQRPDLAAWFVELEIGPLLADPGSEELARTLRTVIGLGGSLARTAEALFVHRNTVAYRLRRIEEILGRDPLGRSVETYAALLLAEQLP